MLFTAILFSQTKTIVLSKEKLQDKINGGWAGQTIGVTFGGPYEFQFNGTFIGDYQPLKWYDGYLKYAMLNNHGLYDDLLPRDGPDGGYQNNGGGQHIIAITDGDGNPILYDDPDADDDGASDDDCQDFYSCEDGG